MHLGLNVINAWSPREMVDLARVAEGTGWEGFFLWDHVSFDDPTPLHDPWVTLGAVATATRRLRIGPLVTPLARRRPHVVARQAVTLDHLSRGRAILGVGLGGTPWEFEAFGEAADPRVRAAKLDEALDVISHLWTGEAVDHRGEFFTVRNQTFRPPPVQSPRIPVWVGGNSGPALHRALRWDGWAPFGLGLDTMAKMLARAGRPRAGFDVIYTPDPPAAAVPTDGGGRDITWWLEPVDGRRFRGFRAAKAFVEAGPPEA